MKIFPPFIVAASLMLVPCAAQAEAVAVLRYPAAEAVTLNTVVWSGGRFIAAGENGVILTSATGDAWQSQTSPMVRRWLCGASGGGRTLLAGDRGSMIESADGATWTVVIPPMDPAIPGIEKFTSFNHAFVDSGKFFFSSEGSDDTWVSSSVGQWSWFTAPSPHSSLNGFSQGPSGVVCSSGVESALLRFTGSGWSAVAMAPSSPEIARLVWTGSRYIGISSGGGIGTSSDGVTWTARTSGVTSTLNGILWTGSQAVIVGEGGVILTSPDGGVWTKRSSGTTRKLTAAAWSGSSLAAVGEAGVILTSPDGSLWTKRNEPTPPLAVTGLTWLSTGGYAFAGGDTSTRSLRSTDGISWTQAAGGPVAPLVGAATNGDRVVLATARGLWQGPADGSAWTSLNAIPTGVAWDGQRFWAPLLSSESFICSVRGLASSSDGAVWNDLVPGSCLAVTENKVPKEAFIWTGGRYVRNRFSSGDIVSGGDLISSEPVTGTQGLCNFLVRTGAEVLAVGANGQVCSSPTGEHWTEKTPPQADMGPLLSVAWAEERLLAAEVRPNGGGGGVHSWTPSGGWTRISDVPARSVAWTGSRVIVAAADGIYTLENLPAVPVTWGGWISLYFPGVQDPAVIGVEADPDGDGSANLIEYGGGSEPAARGSQPVQRVIIEGERRAFEWTADTSRSDVTLVAQVSANLSTWDDVGGTAVQTAGTIVTKQFTAPAIGRYFFRLKATLAD